VTEAPIVRAGSLDAPWIADLIGSAFHRLEATEWLVPDAEERVRVLAGNFEILVDHALTFGEVHVAGERSAVAVWMPRGYVPLPAPDDYERRVEKACGEATSRFLELDALFDQHHPEEPHHHLAFLAVREDQQGRGLGSALLTDHHRHLDERGVPAFLEASSTRARDLYARHGYQPHGEPYQVPNGALFYPMWRDPA
jgi:ribosomal protein S18 acetylase RimI-like enzyme